MTNTNKILVIVTNTSDYEKAGYRTGLWLGEVTQFWDIAGEAGFKMDIASPSGGYTPIDPASLMEEVLMQGGTAKRYEDRDFMDLLVNTMKVSEAKVEDYDAIYLEGGHGASFDFPKSSTLTELITKFYEAGKLVAAICHGPAAFLEVKLNNGDYLIKGKNLTSFAWEEEIQFKRNQVVPFNLEDELRKRGANFSKASEAFGSCVVEDGLLITGQNPASGIETSKAIVKKLQEARGKAA